MTAQLQTPGSSNDSPVRQPGSSTEESLLARLLDVENEIRQAPARRGDGPLDLNPDLVRLALEEAELLERLDQARSVTP